MGFQRALPARAAPATVALQRWMWNSGGPEELMITNHHLRIADSRHMATLPDRSIDLVVTSPPYPMIEMWDELFRRQNAAIGPLLANSDGPAAFEQMHQELDRAWGELYRVLKDGGLACINIGDATRTWAAASPSTPTTPGSSPGCSGPGSACPAGHSVAQADQRAQQVHGLGDAAAGCLRHPGA
jgi:hypothetical protein